MAFDHHSACHSEMYQNRGAFAGQLEPQLLAAAVHRYDSSLAKRGSD
jgi:hypothetical protein